MVSVARINGLESLLSCDEVTRYETCVTWCVFDPPENKERVRVCVRSPTCLTKRGVLEEFLAGGHRAGLVEQQQGVVAMNIRSYDGRYFLHELAIRGLVVNGLGGYSSNVVRVQMFSRLGCVVLCVCVLRRSYDMTCCDLPVFWTSISTHEFPSANRGGARGRAFKKSRFRFGFYNLCVCLSGDLFWSCVW